MNDTLMIDPFMKVKAERSRPLLQLIIRDAASGVEMPDMEHHTGTHRPAVARRWLRQHADAARAQGFEVETADDAVTIALNGVTLSTIRIDGLEAAP